MYEDFETYRSRVRQLVSSRACFPPSREPLCTAEGLRAKVGEEGFFKPFFGDTVIFPLTQRARAELGALQAELYARAGFMLAEALPPGTFHITLHDLSAGMTEEAAAEVTAHHKEQILPVLQTIRTEGAICLRSIGIVSMAASSLVMLFEPVTEADHTLIQSQYHAIDAVFPLSYPLTLHCTLAYYRPGEYSRWNGLTETVGELNGRAPMETGLSCASMTWSGFRSMKEYIGLA